MVLLLVLGTMIYIPEAMVNKAAARKLAKNHNHKAASSGAEAVTTTVTETVVEYITATPNSPATVSTLPQESLLQTVQS